MKRGSRALREMRLNGLKWQFATSVSVHGCNWSPMVADWGRLRKQNLKYVKQQRLIRKASMRTMIHKDAEFV